jgi:hypothetical protein
MIRSLDVPGHVVNIFEVTRQVGHTVVSAATHPALVHATVKLTLNQQSHFNKMVKKIMLYLPLLIISPIELSLLRIYVEK